MMQDRELYPRACTIIINLTCMFFCYNINIILSYSFKVEFAIIILEITQDELHVVAAQVQTLHFNVFFDKI